jgi:Homeobox KN domain
MRGPKNQSTELRWVQMNPSEWLEILKAEAMSSGTLKPIVPDPHQKHFGTESFTSSISSLATTFPVGQKRYGATPSAEMELDVDRLLSTVDATSMPSLWNFQSIHPSPLVDRTRKLVLAIEAQSTFEVMKPSLEQIRDHFTFWLSKMKSLPQHRSLERFEMLCHDTITKLQHLLTEAMGFQEFSCHVSSPNLIPSVDFGVVQSSPAHTQNRTAFHSHMNNWLRANWINPYPDEAVSHQLAYETGENVHVVNTWLVNARSRRWRPAVLKAFELGRPSEHLLEDSINIFEDKPLRPVHEVTSTESSKRLRRN